MNPMSRMKQLDPMNPFGHARALAVCVACLILPIGVAAEESDAKGSQDAGASPPRRAAGVATTPAVAKDVPVLAAPTDRRPGRRPGGSSRYARVALPTLQGFSPNGIGLTLAAQPTLYWRLSDATDAGAEITLMDPAQGGPLIHETLAGPIEAGVHSISLADYSVSLELDTVYVWLVTLALVTEEANHFLTTGGRIERVEASEELERSLAAAEPGREAFALAGGGVWYDAIDRLSEASSSSPAGSAQAGEALRWRNALLRQVGLGNAE